MRQIYIRSKEAQISSTGTRSIITAAAVFLVLAFALPCAARDAQNSLSFIQYPLNTRPAITTPGGYITIDVAESIYNSCSCAFHIFIGEGASQRELFNLERLPNPEKGIYRFKAPAPRDIPPGLHSLTVRKGSNNDTSRRAVAIRDSIPADFTILHLTDIHTGRETYTDISEKSTLLFDAMPDIANNLSPDLVIITGDTTHQHTPDEFNRFLEVLDRFNAPTFVSPGNHDSGKPGDAERVFGPGNYSFSFGGAIFISIDTQEPLIFPDTTGRIHLAKETLAANRGATFRAIFTHQYENLQPRELMRALAPEKPDLALLGHIHIENRQLSGGALFLTTSAYAEGFYRVLKVSESKIISNKQFIIDRSGNPYFAIHGKK